MDLSALRALVRDLNFETHGVDATVTPPGADPIDTRGIWVTPLQDAQPAGSTFSRRDQIRVFAVRRTEVPSAPRGTRIQAAEAFGGGALTWQVDGVERVDADHVRLFVAPVTDES